MTTSFASILNDPYIQKQLRNLKSSLSFSNNNSASVAVADKEVQTNNFDGIKISSSESQSLDVVVDNLLSESDSIDTTDIEELAIYEELIDQLPSFFWKNSLNRALSDDLKKDRLLHKLDELRDRDKKDDIESINDLKRFSRDVQRVTADLESILSDEEMEPVHRTKQYLGELVNDRMNSLYKEDPIEQCLQLSKEVSNRELKPEVRLNQLHSLKEQLELAKTQVTIPVEKSERKALRLKYLESEKSYKQTIEDLLHNLPEVDSSVQKEIINLLNINEFNQLENKDAFISDLDTNLFVDIKERDAKKLVEKQLGLFLLKQATTPEELKKALLMIDILSFKKLHGDHQDMVAETLLKDDKELLQSSDIDNIDKKIIEYSSNIDEVLQSVNNSISIKNMIAILNEYFQEEWSQIAEAKQEQIAKQLILKIEIRPYRSLKRIESDFKKASRQKLITDSEIEKLPYIYTSRSEDVFYLTSEATNGTKTFIKTNSFNKNQGSADTFTLIYQ